MARISVLTQLFSAVAAKVTGPHWNRFRFFGLHEPGITEGKA